MAPKLSDTRAIRAHLNTLKEADIRATIGEKSYPSPREKETNSAKTTLNRSLLNTKEKQSNGNYCITKEDIMRHFVINSRIAIQSKELTQIEKRTLVVENNPTKLFSAKFNSFIKSFIEEIKQEMAADNILYLGGEKSEIEKLLTEKSKVLLQSEVKKLQAKEQAVILNQNVAETKQAPEASTQAAEKEVPTITLPAEKNHKLKIVEVPRAQEFNPELFQRIMQGLQAFFKTLDLQFGKPSAESKAMITERVEGRVNPLPLLEAAPTPQFISVPEDRKPSIELPVIAEVRGSRPVADRPTHRAPHTRRTPQLKPMSHSNVSEILKLTGWILVGTAALLGLAVLTHATCGLILPFLGIAAIKGQAIAGTSILTAGAACLFADKRIELYNEQKEAKVDMQAYNLATLAHTG